MRHVDKLEPECSSTRTIRATINISKNVPRVGTSQGVQYEGSPDGVWTVVEGQGTGWVRSMVGVHTLAFAFAWSECWIGASFSFRPAAERDVQLL